jgi:malonate transporter and related proteins
MSDVLAITGPIYLIIAIGYLATRGGLFARSDMRVFGQFVLQLALPALLFRTLASRPVGEVLHWNFLIAYAGGSLALAIGVLLWARRMRGVPTSKAAIMAMGMTCSNSGFIGYPLVLQLLGPQAGVPLAMVLIVENLIMLPLLIALSDMDPQGAGPGQWQRAFAQSVKRLSKNPMIIAIALGVVFALLGWHLPAPAARAVDLFATSCGALALFVIGGSLFGLKREGVQREVAIIAMGKLLLHPVAVVILLILLPPLPLYLRTAAVVMAAVPMLGIYPILAQKSGNDGMAAAAQLVATVLSFGTLTSLVWMLRHGGWGI